MISQFDGQLRQLQPLDWQEEAKPVGTGENLGDVQNIPLGYNTQPAQPIKYSHLKYPSAHHQQRAEENT